LTGEFVWKTSFHEADLLPTLNRQQIAAVGSLNDKLSMFFAPDGQVLGTYQRAAIFAQHLDDTWIAFAGNNIARLTSTGHLLWDRAVPIYKAYGWSDLQPIVDREGYVYLLSADGIMCLDPEGAEVFAVPANGAQLLGLSIVAEDTLACIVNDELWLIQS
jgi:hypothetical protein